MSQNPFAKYENAFTIYPSNRKVPVTRLQGVILPFWFSLRGVQNCAKHYHAYSRRENKLYR